MSSENVEEVDNVAVTCEGEVDAIKNKPTVENSSCEIFKGKRFQSIEDAKDSYQQYGATQGFTIRIRTTRKDKIRSEELTGVRFVCSCEGRYKSKSVESCDALDKCRSSHERRGCGALMNIKKVDLGNFWLVSKFKDEHCHELTSPRRWILMRSQRSMPAPAKKLLHCFDEEGIQLSKVVPLFVVNMNLKSMEGSCSYNLFESMGIPCKHILAVLVHRFVAEIPSYFILQRWRKDAATSLSAPVYLSHGASHNVSEAIIAADFCKRTTQLSFSAARTEEGRSVLNELIENAYSRLKEIDDRLLTEETNPNVTEGDNVGETVGDTIAEVDEMEERILLDPHVSQTKGRTKVGNQQGGQNGNNKRMRSGIEISQQQKKKQVRKCKICNVSGHYATTCPSK